jgi:hypothetical protein
VPVQDDSKSLRLEELAKAFLDSSRLAVGLAAPRPQAPEVVNRSRAVVLQANKPRQLNEQVPKFQDRALEQFRMQSRFLLAQPLG